MKQKAVRKRVLTILLSAALIVTMLPSVAIEAFAESGSDGYTRAEWIQEIVSAFNMTVEEDNYPDNYYSDISSDDAYYRDIMVAVEFGVIDLAAGEAFEPTAPATRDFAVHTMNYCLGFEFEGSNYLFSDSEDTAYPKDAQIAVERGWVSLIDGRFCPNQSITKAEGNVMFADAEAVKNTETVDISYENAFHFKDETVIIPETAEVQRDEEGNLLIYDYEGELLEGDIFVAYVDEFPEGFLAKSVERSSEEGCLIVSVESRDISEFLADMDAQGETTGILLSAEPVDGATITYIEGGTKARAYEDGVQYTSLRTASKANIRAIKISRQIKISDGISADVSATVSNLSFTYNINSSRREAYINLEGTLAFTGTAKVDTLAATGGNKKMVELANIPILGVGALAVSVDLELLGQASLSYITDFSVGYQQFSSGEKRAVKNFQKKNFTISAEITCGMFLRVELGLTKIPCVRGYVFAETGVKVVYSSKQYNDGMYPNKCANLRSWNFARMGYYAGYGFVLWKDSVSDTIIVYDENNSPIRVVFHYEDDRQVTSCSRGEKGYYTKWNSKYGYNGMRQGYSTDGSESNPLVIWQYTLDKDENATITKYQGNASALIIPETIDGYNVTKIGSSAFYGNTTLRTVIIPDSVTEIGSSAFRNCSNLESVSLSKGLRSLGSEAFGNCTSLTMIEIPKSLEKCGLNSSMTTGNKYGPFAGCDMLKTVTFEEGTTCIVDYLLCGCDGIEQIKIPNTVTKIGELSFRECDNLEVVEIPNSVTSIGSDAFRSCVKLSGVVIPDSVTNIGSLAFYNCRNLKSVSLSKGLKSLGSEAFGNCTSLTMIEIPKRLEKCGYSYSMSTPSEYFGPFAGCNMLKTVTFEEGTSCIVDYLLCGCDGIEQIKIPNTVTKIGELSFRECENLEAVEIPNSVTSIGSDAFRSCVKLSGVVIPDSVTYIGSYAFENCSNLESVSLSKGLKSLGSNAFRNCTSLTMIEIPKSLEKCDYSYTTSTQRKYFGPFAGCDMLKTVTFEEGTTCIVDYLLCGSDGIEQIKIPNTVTKIGELSFRECDNLEVVEIPNSVTSIGSDAFRGCVKLSEIAIPDSVIEIGNSAFCDCKSLESAVLPQTLEKINNSTFSGCKALSQITLPETLTYIDSYAFSNSGLTEIEIPENVTQIYSNAFKNCTSLEKLVIRDSKAPIGSSAFFGCVALADVELGSKITSIGSSAFSGCDALTEIKIPDSVTALGSNIFEHCGSLSDVSLSAGITEIPQYAFNQCAALEKIKIPYKVTKISSNAFTNCVKLKEITIPRKTQTIASGVFSYPANMTMYGVAGTYAETYANNNNIRFVNQEIKAQKITLSDDNPKVVNGGTYTPTLIVEPADFTDAITWKSSNTNIATVTADGVIKGIGLGSTTIKVIVGDVSKSFTISVVQPVTSVSLNKTSISLEALDTYKLTASVYPSNADDKRIEWTTSDETVVSVDENGNIAALKKGTAKITAKALDGSGCSRVCTVTVTNNAHMVQEISELETSHPYEANCSDFWQYTLPGAETIAVTFSEETCMEENFDYIKIYGIDKELIGTYTGSELSGRTIKILGDTVRIKIVSDDSGADYGFKVSEIRRIGEIGDANGDGKVTMADTVRIARYVVGLAEIGSEGMFLADINNDGLVTIADAILIAKYVAAQA